MKTTNKKSGFTLVELAIVLVIIGLIVGGVLAGSDLIKAATIRSGVNQVNQYNTAALAFQNKYNGLPGDLANATANTALSVTTMATTTGAGDGNGLVQGLSAAGTACTSTYCLPGEPSIFFPSLLSANLIGDTLTSPNLNPGSTAFTAVSAFPASKLAGNLITVTAVNGLNYFLIDGITGTASGYTTTGFTIAAGLSPLQASQIDGKIDDGNGVAGTVLAVVPDTTPVPGTADTAGAAKCVTSSGYNVGAQYGSTPLCALSIRAAF